MKSRRPQAALRLLLASAMAPFTFAGDQPAQVEIKDPEFAIPIPHDYDYAKTILNWQTDVTGKPLRILEFGQQQTPGSPGILFSGTFWGTYAWESSNTPGKFPILSRFPDQHGVTDSDASRAIINNSALGITARPINWLTFYSQLEYTEIEFPGQEDWQFRKAFVLIGDLDKCPWYGYFGRNTIDFGWMDGYNPFTHTVNNHFFRVDTEDPAFGLGYAKNGLHVIGTLIHSGRQWRVADTEDDTGYGNPAINASYTFDLSDDSSFRLGGGYLHSTIYNRDVAHHPGAGFPAQVAASTEIDRNPAYDLFAEYKRGPFRLGAEYTMTGHDWPATSSPVRATAVQAAYDFEIFDKPSTLSAVYSVGRQGPDGTEFHQLSQFAVGIQTEITPFLSLAFEYVRNDAFIPLANIASISDGDVVTDTFIVGGKITF